MNGYVIEYGKDKKVFVDEGHYISALECLRALGERVQVAQWVDHQDDVLIPTLDEKSFGYVIEYSAENNQSEVKRMFVPADKLEETTVSLCRHGVKPMLSRWTNLVLNPAVNAFFGDTANEEQIAALKGLCKDLMDKDETQEEFVQAIAMKTSDFTNLKSSVCTALCANLAEIIARYGQ